MVDQTLHNSMAHASGKKITTMDAKYLVMFLFLATIIYLLTMMANHNLTGSIVFMLIHLVGFLALGLMSLYILKRYYRGEFLILINKRWRLSLIEAALIAVAALVIYKFTGILHPMMVAAALACFLLPITIDEAFRAFRQMPGVVIITWQPSGEITGQRPNYKKNTELRLRLTKKTGIPGSSPEIITGSVSDYDQLGIAFNQLIGYSVRSSSPAIDIRDDNGTDFEWSFSASDPVLGKRWLDPYASLRTNKITPQVLVSVKRIKTTDI